MHTRAGVRFATELRTYGAQTALRLRDGSLTYDELADRVDELVDRLGPQRRLVLLTVSGNDVGSMVGYLAALAGGHPVIVAAADTARVETLATTFDPDALIVPTETGVQVVERRDGTRHDLHPELALLLSTSGTTGSAKLVRLSHTNLDANAEAIADSLGITAEDRAMTSLPMHYCYGLSVVNSHLRQGASLVLTDRSVVDRCFWDQLRAVGGTTFAGVPYTFELLDRVGFEHLTLPSLRYVTQAGGRLAPDAVRRYADLGRRNGWELVVMYGQTEATARMAYLPPDQVAGNPSAIGIPIPGGTFRIEPLGDDPDHGELVYRGPNVMLGYANGPEDLALGATVDELATGDLARRRHDGLFEVVGRRSRFVKPFGLRVDLDQVEATLATRGVEALVTGTDAGVVLAVGPGTDGAHARLLVREHTGLPRSAVASVTLSELPRLANGKPDYETIRRLASSEPSDAAAAALDRPTEVVAPVEQLRLAFAEVLQRDDVTDDSTFVGLGGDSLSYVEMSIRLEDHLGTLPVAWHTLTVRELAAHARRRSACTRVETSVVLRAVAIVLIVANHTGLFDLPGGAHVLLGVAGFNFARFALTAGRLGRSIARVAVPSMCWIGLVAAASDDFALPHALLLNAQLGAPDARWAYWFVEALIQTLTVLALLLAIPAIRRLDRDRPLVVPTIVFSIALVIRFDLLPLPALDHRTSRPHEVLWLFAAGWLAARASTVAHRLAVTVAIAAGTIGFFGHPQREAIVLGGIALLVWLPHVPIPRPTTRAVGLLAGTSLYIYLTHWQLYPPLLDRFGPAVAWSASILGGVLIGLGAQRLSAVAEARFGQARTARSDVLHDHGTAVSLAT